MDAALLLQQIVNGLVIGSSYALVALGFTLVLGTLDLLNFAHGETIMIAAFAALFSLTALDLPLLLTFVVAVLVGAVVAGVVYVASIRYVNKTFWAAPALSAVGIGLLLQTGATRLFGTNQREVPDPLRAAQVAFGEVTVSASQILIIAVALAMMVALHLLLVRTRVGKAIRAVAESMTTAALLGVNVERVIATTLVISGVLAGIAAVLTSFAYTTITPFIGLNLLLKGMTGMIIGGLGNVYGAMVGGIVVGLLETFTVGYWDATFQDVVVYGVMIAVLMFRPAGIFGARIRKRA
jgi:branched-chain amino acid transport system permease protein